MPRPKGNGQDRVGLHACRGTPWSVCRSELDPQEPMDPPQIHFRGSRCVA